MFLDSERTWIERDTKHPDIRNKARPKATERVREQLGNNLECGAETTGSALISKHRGAQQEASKLLTAVTVTEGYRK